MYVVKSRHDLAKDEGNETAREWTTFSSFDEMIEVAFHGLEYKVEFLGGRKEEEIVQRDDIRVEGYCAQRL